MGQYCDAEASRFQSVTVSDAECYEWTRGFTVRVGKCRGRSLQKDCEVLRLCASTKGRMVVCLCTSLGPPILPGRSQRTLLGDVTPALLVTLTLITGQAAYRPCQQSGRGPPASYLSSFTNSPTCKTPRQAHSTLNHQRASDCRRSCALRKISLVEPRSLGGDGIRSKR